MRLLTGFVVALFLVACNHEGEDPPARCGNGVVETGETSVSCCADAGCPRGVCDTTTMTCVQPWSFTCPTETGTCADDLPYVCDADPPSYDCTTCGCPDGHTCFEDFCFADGVPALERSGHSPPDDLPLDDYFPMVDWAATAPAMTYAELVTELDTLLREDGRRMALLLGESHGSEDEKATGVQILRDVIARDWLVTELGIEWHGAPILDEELFEDLGLETQFIDGDLTNVAYCSAALGQPNDINAQGLYVQYSGSGHTSQEVCHHPYHWNICDLPHTSECLASTGRRAITVILFDPHIWLWVTDRILLWRLGDLYPNAAEVTTNLEASIAGFETHMAMHTKEAKYDATANGRALNVRVLPAQNTDDVFFAFFPRPARPPYLMKAFQVAWNDPTLQAVFLAHDIEPGNCSISWDLTEGAEMFWLYCGSGYEIQAQVDGTTWELLSSEMITP